MFVKTFGLLISIIDFTLSRINTGMLFHSSNNEFSLLDKFDMSFALSTNIR